MSKVVIFFKIFLILASTFPWITESSSVKSIKHFHTSEIAVFNRLQWDEVPDTATFVSSLKTLMTPCFTGKYQIMKAISPYKVTGGYTGGIITNILFVVIKAKAP